MEKKLRNQTVKQLFRHFKAPLLPYLSPGHFEKNSFVCYASAHPMPRRPPCNAQKFKARRSIPQSERWFVVFVGSIPGPVQGWHLCQERTSGIAGSRFAAFADRPAAQHAWRSDGAWLPPPDASTECRSTYARSIGLQRRPIGVNTKIKVCRWNRSRNEFEARLSRQSRADEESRAEAEGAEKPGSSATGESGGSGDDESGGAGKCSPGPGAYSSQRQGSDSDSEEEEHGGAAPPLQTA